MNEELKDLLINNIDPTDNLDDGYELYEHLDYNGGVHEIIDSNIDIYYYNLREWAVDHYRYIEQAISEGITEGVEDFHKLIQCGQYLQLVEQAHEIVNDLFREHEGKLFNIKGVA